jgi:uncharacterized membrane protein SpoIIM required for sporulation
VVYGTAARRAGLGAFFFTGYWRRVRERPRLLLLSGALLLAPAALCAAWGASDPVAASAIAPGSLASIGDPRAEGSDFGLTPDEQAALSSEILTNNIRVSFLAFAGGITAGALTIFVLLFNGALIGAVAGIAVAAGNGSTFTELVAPHGVLELSCIVVSGAAGLRLGSALVDPGRRRRSAALRDEGRAAAELVLGTAPWLVLAGVVEGFITPERVGLAPALVVGFGLGAVYWALAVTRGHGPSA